MFVGCGSVVSFGQYTEIALLVSLYVWVVPHQPIGLEFALSKLEIWGVRREGGRE